MKFTDKLQRLLPFGYLYLIILGLIKENIYYNQFGINILRYSTIMDILLSPIADIFSDLKLTISLLIIAACLAFFLYLLYKNSDKPFIKKRFLSNKTLSQEEILNHFSSLFIKVIAFSLLSFFLGVGLGRGKRLEEELANGKLEYNKILILNSNEKKTVRLIGINSMYFFYFEKGQKHVKISPIETVNTVELIP